MNDPQAGEGFANQWENPTGIRNLDLILGGGVPSGSLIMVVGPPGSGKTTLAAQMAFGVAVAGAPVLVLTTFSEPPSKLVAHLRSFTFFDEALIGGAVRILSLEQFLPDGLASTGDELLALARETRVGLVVLDGFSALRDADPRPQPARQFLYHVGGTLSTRAVTTIITTEANPSDPTLFPEATTADLIMGLHFQLDGVRRRRGIEVIKVRGRAELPGLHGLVIDAAGMTVYPRLEARVATITPNRVASQAPDRLTAVAPFGIPGLDQLLGGGITRATTTLLAGSLGAGKTLLGLQFALAGIRAGEPVTLLGFRETAGQLGIKAELLGHGEAMRAALESGGPLTFLIWPPVELNPDVVADHLLAALARTGARRLVIDSIAELERAPQVTGDARRMDEYLAALVVILRDRGITTLAIKESRQTVVEGPEYLADSISMMADNVLLLRQRGEGEHLRRTLAILKMRYSVHDAAIHDFLIAPPHGIQVGPSFHPLPADTPPPSRTAPTSEPHMKPVTDA